MCPFKVLMCVHVRQRAIPSRGNCHSDSCSARGTSMNRRRSVIAHGGVFRPTLSRILRAHGESDPEVLRLSGTNQGLALPSHAVLLCCYLHLLLF